MKIDVLTVPGFVRTACNDVEIKKWRWWSNWVDVAVFDHDRNYRSEGYLLQMKVSRRNGKRFKCVPLKSLIGSAHPSTSQAGHLTQTRSA